MLSSSANAQYSGVTPKRPDAICLMRELRSRAVPRVRKRAGSSPPSPQLLLPPIMFIAMASVSCASADSEPCDMAPVEKRRVIVLGRLDLVERHGRAGRHDLEQVVQLGRSDGR